MRTSTSYFPRSYAQARERFALAARPLADPFCSYGIEHTGSEGEALATDVAYIGDPDADRLLIMTSAVLGVEGFCGSACQLALLDDDAMLAVAREAGVALLLVHAVNPYGYSWVARTDECNIDLNRNGLPFDGRPLPQNPEYARIHDLLLPQEWPPAASNQQLIAQYIAEHGQFAFAQAVSRGQYTHADGLFYGGDHPAASLQNLRRILHEHARTRTHIGWIDVHTGWGPRGHGEKLYAGRHDDAEIARARQWWGCDVTVPYLGDSISVDISGQLADLIYQACPLSIPTTMAIVFGVVRFDAMVHALCGRNWLRAHPGAPDELRRDILQATLDAFYCNEASWHGMVLGQTRVAVLQALRGLQAA